MQFKSLCLGWLSWNAQYGTDLGSRERSLSHEHCSTHAMLSVHAYMYYYLSVVWIFCSWHHVFSAVLHVHGLKPSHAACLLFMLAVFELFQLNNATLIFHAAKSTWLTLILKERGWGLFCLHDCELYKNICHKLWIVPLWYCIGYCKILHVTSRSVFKKQKESHFSWPPWKSCIKKVYSVCNSAP